MGKGGQMTGAWSIAGPARPMATGMARYAATTWLRFLSVLSMAVWRWRLPDRMLALHSPTIAMAAGVRRILLRRPAGVSRIEKEKEGGQ